MNRKIEYIQALEKAVKEKYGDLTTQHPKQFWDEDKEKDYIEQQKEFVKKQIVNEETSEKIEVDGVLLTKKLINKSINRVCNICKEYSFNKRDDIYITKFKACYRCYVCKLEENK